MRHKPSLRTLSRVPSELCCVLHALVVPIVTNGSPKQCEAFSHLKLCCEGKAPSALRQPPTHTIENPEQHEAFYCIKLACDGIAWCTPCTKIKTRSGGTGFNSLWNYERDFFDIQSNLKSSYGDLGNRRKDITDFKFNSVSNC